MIVHARNSPLEVGVSAESARHAAGIPDLRLLDALVTRTPGLQLRSGRVCRAGAAPDYPPPVAAALHALEERLLANPFDAPERLELEAAGLSPNVLAAAAAAGRLLRLAADVVLLPAAQQEAVRRLCALPQPFTASQARQCLQTSRRVTIPLLEYLDGTGRTRRVDGQARVLLQTPGADSALRAVGAHEAHTESAPERPLDRD